MAALALPALGALAGNALIPAGLLGVSGAGIGWAIGGMLAGSLQTQKVQGPRLTDLKLTTSAYGSPIPYVFGHPRIGGQIIWGSSRREISTTTTRRAKGGPKVKSTTYTYEVDLLIKLTCNEMAGIRKIFINGELQWTAASDADFGSINASTALATRITVYPGGPDQLPDPTYEAAVGIGNAPAYRDSLTIMLAGLQLGNAGQIPNLTFEVAQRADDEVNTTQLLYKASGVAANIQAYSDDSYTSIVWARQASSLGTAFDFTHVTPTGVQFDPGTLNLPAFDFTMSGRSDRLVLLGAGPNLSNTFYANFFDNLPTRTFVFTGIPRIFVVLGSDMVVSRRSTAPYTLSRYDLSNAGMSPIISTTTSDVVKSMAIIGTELYVHYEGPHNGTQTIEVFDLETLVPTGEVITTPVGNGGAEILEDELGGILFLNSTELWSWDGAEWHLLMTVPAGYGAIQSTGWVYGANPYYRGESLYTSRQGSGSDLYVRVVWPALNAQSIPLDEAVAELCVRAGIDVDFINAAALSSQEVRAWAITPSTTRAALEAAAQAYQFESACSDELRFIRLGGTSAKTIIFDDLGTTGPGDQIEPIPLAERNDIEMPAYVTVKYMNVSNDYQDGTERSSRIATESDAEQFVEIAMGLTPEEAKRTANFIANIIQASLTSIGPLTLQTKHSAIQPADVVTVTDRDGSTYRIRVAKAEWARGILKIEGVFDNASAASGDPITDDDYTSTSTIRAPSVTLYVLGDWPLFRDEDDNVGHYWAANGAGDFWPGAALFKSTDDVTYVQVSQIEERGIVGTAVTALANYAGPNIPDEVSVVRVNVGNSTLASITYDEQIAQTGENVFMIGRECIVARVATYVSPGVYDLSGLLRGRLGTEWAMGTHTAGEEVAKIQMAGMRRVGMDLAELNLDRFYRAPTFTRPLDSSPARIFANTGVSSMPYAPASLDSDRDEDAGTTTVFWVRRTRLSENWLAGTVPLGEEVELFRVRRYTDGTYTMVAEEQEVSDQDATFSTATNPIYVGIAQWSARVGWGYELRGAI